MNTLPAARAVSAAKACVIALSGAPMLTVIMSAAAHDCPYRALHLR
jgi:hypothetical protein